MRVWLALAVVAAVILFWLTRRVRTRR